MAIILKIAVGMSGGVDSSVAALRLKEAGHTVYGIMMKLWKGKSAANTSRHACYDSNEDQEIELAKKVCDTIKIPFHSTQEPIFLHRMGNFQEYSLCRTKSIGRYALPREIGKRFFKSILADFFNRIVPIDQT